jgi:Xaa-Pro aminopeptidase
LARLRAVAQVLGEAYTRFERVAAPGSTERQLHRVFTAAAAESGADRVGYTSVVADIERGALAGPSDRRWEKGHLLMIDAGIVLDGYWADFSRIYASESITYDEARAYRGLVESLQRGRAIVRPNISAATVVRALSEAGERRPVFGRAGHGIGLDLTEPPSLHPDEPKELEWGMTLCLEPNRLVPGIGYVAAEEEVVVTETGAEPLSPPFPSELKVLG